MVNCIAIASAALIATVVALPTPQVPALAADVLNQQAEAAAIADTFLTTSVFPAVAAAKRQVGGAGGNVNVAPTVAVVAQAASDVVASASLRERQVGGAGGNVNVAPTVAVVAQAASDVVASGSLRERQVGGAGGNVNVAPTIGARQVGGAGGNVNLAPTIGARQVGGAGGNVNVAPTIGARQVPSVPTVVAIGQEAAAQLAAQANVQAAQLQAAAV